jgi:mannose-6-phosphate isomerase-like protein (cupin superfamily)
MPLTIHNLPAMAAKVDQPFALITLGLVGDIGIHMYVAQGALDWHKHIDEDEIFLVHEGGLRIESELGKITLYPEEVIFMPKGVAHRSQSALRSTVLLFRQQILADRKNGHRNYLVTDDREPLAKARLAGFLGGDTPSYQPAPVVFMEGYELSVFTANGFSDNMKAASSGALLYVTQGAVGIETVGKDTGGARLDTGQLTILPGNTSYKLHASSPAVVVKFERAQT